MATPRRSLRIDDETWADIQRRAESAESVSEFIRQALEFGTLDKFPYVVYRFYSDDDQLLYVGCSVRWKTRLRWHAANQPWWNEVRHIALDHFPNSELAANAEMAAMENECPRHNKDTAARYRHGGRANVTVLNLRLPDDLHDQIKEMAGADLRTLNAEIVWLLEQEMKKRKAS